MDDRGSATAQWFSCGSVAWWHFVAGALVAVGCATAPLEPRQRTLLYCASVLLIVWLLRLSIRDAGGEYVGLLVLPDSFVLHLAKGEVRRILSTDRHHIERVGSLLRIHLVATGETLGLPVRRAAACARRIGAIRDAVSGSSGATGHSVRLGYTGDRQRIGWAPAVKLLMLLMILAPSAGLGLLDAAQNNLTPLQIKRLIPPVFMMAAIGILLALAEKVVADADQEQGKGFWYEIDANGIRVKPRRGKSGLYPRESVLAVTTQGGALLVTTTFGWFVLPAAAARSCSRPRNEENHRRAG